MTHDTSPAEALAMSGINHGIAIGEARERARIARLIGQLELAACVCESAWKSVGYHALQCQREAEAGFRTRLIEAVFSTVPAGPDESYSLGTSGSAETVETPAV